MSENPATHFTVCIIAVLLTWLWPFFASPYSTVHHTVIKNVLVLKPLWCGRTLYLVDRHTKAWSRSGIRNICFHYCNQSCKAPVYSLSSSHKQWAVSNEHNVQYVQECSISHWSLPLVLTHGTYRNGWCLPVFRFLLQLTACVAVCIRS